MSNERINGTLWGFSMGSAVTWAIVGILENRYVLTMSELVVLAVIVFLYGSVHLPRERKNDQR